MEPDFFHFLKFGSLVFLEIAYSESLQQCLASSTGKIHEKYFCAQISVERAKIRPKTGFFSHFLKCGLLVFLEIAYNDSLQQFIASIRGKIHGKKKKKFVQQILAKSGPKLGFFAIFSSLVH